MANAFAADIYLELRLSSEPACRCAYYGRPDFESAGGHRLATLLAAALPGVLGPEADADAGEVRAMQVPILREARMVAVLCEVGPAATVVEQTGALASALAATMVAWAAAPVEG